MSQLIDDGVLGGVVNIALPPRRFPSALFAGGVAAKRGPGTRRQAFPVSTSAEHRA